MVRPGLAGPPDENLFFGLVAFLVDLRIDVTRIRPSAFRNITGHIDKFTGLLAGWADVGGGLDINGIATLIAFENSHSIPPSCQPWFLLIQMRRHWHQTNTRLMLCR